MLLNELGLNIKAFESVTAAVLGDKDGEEGYKVLGEAIEHNRNMVSLRDWFYCLVRAPGTIVRKRLVDDLGKNPDTFVNLIESSIEINNLEAGFPPTKLTSGTVEPSVIKMLETAEGTAKANKCSKISDSILTFALFENLDEELNNLLAAWATEDKIKRISTELRRSLTTHVEVKADLFLDDGKLNLKLFSSSGRKLCHRLQEDASSMGVKMVTTRHLLYSLLDNESGVLYNGLVTAGVDVKKDIHAMLSRELVKPGKKRNNDFVLKKDNIFSSVVSILTESIAIAHEKDDKKIDELAITRAFLSKQAKELTRLFTRGDAISLTSLQDYIENAEVDEEEEGSLYNFSIQKIEDNIKNTIFGQEYAVSRIIPWVKRLRFGIPRENRPAGVFLFLGPTGSGKTQMAKELARYVYGNEDMLIFLEMGQFKTKESMSMFIGSPPGYVGYGDGKLTNGLRDKPQSVVLFDEIEKADAQVFDTLLRFADEGYISDPAGPVRDGTKCIIVMTTNAGQEWLRAHLKDNPNARENADKLSKDLFDNAMKELSVKGFRPEFLGRLDERITFLPFSKDICRKIIDKVLEKEISKFKKMKDIDLEVNEDARDVLAQRVLDRSLDEGARGAPRAINEFIITPAIDIVSDYNEENGKEAVKSLIAERYGLSNIKVEIK